jgi:hypothetical protein
MFFNYISFWDTKLEEKYKSLEYKRRRKLNEFLEYKRRTKVQNS